MLANSQNVLVTGGTFTHVEQRGTPGFTQLRAAIADGAMHDSGERFDPPKCYPGTREVILKKLLDWIIAHVLGDAFIHWLQGTAGIGKSAILQEIAEMCAKQQRLIASFFFSRTAALRNDEKRLVATIAYQLTQSIPATRPYIEKAIENDPAILSKSLDTQLLELVIAPLDTANSRNVTIHPLNSIIAFLGVTAHPLGINRLYDVIEHLPGNVIFTLRSNTDFMGVICTSRGLLLFKG